MASEIERKFFLFELPDITGIEPSLLERHLLFYQDGIEMRIQANSKGFNLVRKVAKSEMERESQTLSISEGEFNRLKQLAIASLNRTSYHLSDSPETDIRVYSGQFSGLIRAEFEFPSPEAARVFTPPAWVGPEITGSLLARDADLLSIDQTTFKELVSKLSAAK